MEHHRWWHEGIILPQRARQEPSRGMDAPTEARRRKRETDRDRTITALAKVRRSRLFRDRELFFVFPIRLQDRSEEHTSELQSQSNLVCRLLLEKKKEKYEEATR